MPSPIDTEDIKTVLAAAGIQSFSGNFTSLGGGEVNDTYKLELPERSMILRMAKDEGQNTLRDEARSLRQLDLPGVPKLLYFDEDNLIHGRMWILESFVPGLTVKRLNTDQFFSLGKLLAKIHSIAAPASRSLQIWEQLLDNCKSFGTEEFLLNHPDGALRKLIRVAYEEYSAKQAAYASIPMSLIHSDATPSNILVNGSEVGLIDWEFSKYSDPMLEFSTVYYEDMEYNRGKWRIQIKPEEKSALFSGYEHAGGKIDEERIRFWIKFDKLGAAVFLYWRLHESKRETGSTERQQYQEDLDNLIKSLQQPTVFN